MFSTYSSLWYSGKGAEYKGDSGHKNPFNININCQPWPVWSLEPLPVRQRGDPAAGNRQTASKTNRGMISWTKKRKIDEEQISYWSLARRSHFKRCCDANPLPKRYNMNYCVHRLHNSPGRRASDGCYWGICFKISFFMQKYACSVAYSW